MFALFSSALMFCPNCGKSEQTPESYCRNCGQFLTDFSSNAYLINKLLGGQTPETQVKVNLTINLITAFISALLLGFLNGYYDGQYARTHEGAPSIIYLVYLFLGLVTVWQILSFLIGLKLKRKIGGRKKGLNSVDASINESDLSSGATQKSLPQADFENLVPTSVAEDTTKILDKLPRR